MIRFRKKMVNMLHGYFFCYEMRICSLLTYLEKYACTYFLINKKNWNKDSL